MSSRTARAETLRDRCDKIRAEEEQLREGGGKAGQERQHKLGRLVARERIARLLDRDAKFFEVGLWAAYKMYEQWGRVPGRRRRRRHRQRRQCAVHDHRQ